MGIAVKEIPAEKYPCLQVLTVKIQDKNYRLFHIPKYINWVFLGISCR